MKPGKAEFLFRIYKNYINLGSISMWVVFYLVNSLGCAHGHALKWSLKDIKKMGNIIDFVRDVSVPE